MDAFEVIKTKLDVREFSEKKVPTKIKLRILEAARLTASGENSQHWRFILVDDPRSLRTLADDSRYGAWVEFADFAIIVLTDPMTSYHMIDTGRVAQDMEIAAWNYGVASCVFTGIKEDQLRKDFRVPPNLKPTITVGFGYPRKKLRGHKDRKPLSEIAFLGRYGRKLDTTILPTPSIRVKSEDSHR